MPGWFTVKMGPAAGAELFLPHSEEGFWLEMVEGGFDKFLYDALRNVRNLSESRVWDIGAHFGYHTLGFAAQGAEVVAFEPNRMNAERLKMHLARNSKLAPRVKLLEVAVSDVDGETVFVQSSDMGGASSGSHLAGATTPLASHQYGAFEQTKVQTVRMDTLIAKGEQPPDVLKIDIEGAEVMALKGGLELLKRHKPILLMEVHHICLMMEIQHLLDKLGYQVQLLDKENAAPSRCFIIATQSKAS
jgi:FkbM family methyltransferase